MNDDIKYFLSLFIGIFVIIFASYAIDSKSCSSQWEHSGIKSDYGFFKGCVVQDKKGNWIPADNYSDFAR